MNKIIKILIITSLFCNASFGLFEPLYAVYVQNIGGGILGASISMGIFAIVLGISTLIIGKISDKGNNKKYFIVTGYGIIIMTFIIYYFLTNIYELIFAQILLGIADAMTGPPWDALFSLNVTKNKEAFEWGLWSGGKNIILGLASIIGGFIVITFGFQGLIICMIILESLAFINISKLISKS